MKTTDRTQTYQTDVWLVTVQGPSKMGLHIEYYTHYGPNRAWRRLATLNKRYKDQPDITCYVKHNNTIYSIAEMRHLIGLLPAVSRSEAGRRGGVATNKKRSAAERTNAAVLAVKARWNKKPK